MASLTAKKIHQLNGDIHHVDSTVKKRGEDAVRALKIAQINLNNNLEELDKATPAHQTLGDLIVKDILIVSSILFWPVVIYWLW
ncbi:MAG: hypothetical protein GY742_06120 [Hyphomicrobiales bacterium]|nr:hypothetical protein [Hyphomicrobiales bacterium]